MIDAIRYARTVCDDDTCELSRAARNILHWTASFCDTRTGEAEVGVRRLAKLSGFNVRYVNLAQHELVDAGVITVRRRQGSTAIWVFPVRSQVRPQVSTSGTHPTIHNRARSHPQRVPEGHAARA